MTVMRTEQLGRRLLLRTQDIHACGCSFDVTPKPWLAPLSVTSSLCVVEFRETDIKI